MDQIVENMRVKAVMNAARHQGLLGEKSRRLGVRVSPRLVEEAKKQTGIESDTNLVEFALAALAVTDAFGTEFLKLRGTIDPDIDLDL